ncbi:hypothetical protein ACOSP6_11800 [Tenacibaculum sp. MEBiC06402]|uniref:hypothetical protein n=1 Tax=unclassified Tenacibaculum TaxID=2635139 RepID=UPI003B99E417
MRKIKFISLLLYSLIGFLLSGCKETNWRENFRERSKEPFGTYIIQNEIKTLFKDQEVEILNKHIDDYFIDIYYDYEAEFANYVCVKQASYRLGKNSIKKLLDFVSVGNDVFLSLYYFNDTLEETLGFKTTNIDDDAYSIKELKTLKGTISLENNSFKKRNFTYDRNLRKNFFSEYNKETTTILGTQNVNDTIRPNFIKIKYEKGNVFLHTQPIVFTNYFLLNGNHEYVENVFSYLPNSTVLWDPQIRPSKYQGNQEDDTSALSFFMEHPSLKWSLYVAFTGLLLFMFLNARRKQRAIPEVKQLKNSTQDFTHTIANLYLKEENHKNIVSKKITYFLERIRTKYHLETQNLNSTFIEKLAAKSGNTVHTTNYLINTIITLNNKSMCTQDELVRLNTLIENFLENK